MAVLRKRQEPIAHTIFRALGSNLAKDDSSVGGSWQRVAADTITAGCTSMTAGEDFAGGVSLVGYPLPSSVSLAEKLFVQTTYYAWDGTQIICSGL